MYAAHIYIYITFLSMNLNDIFFKLNKKRKALKNTTPAAIRWYTSMELILRCIFYVPSAADSDWTVKWGEFF